MVAVAAVIFDDNGHILLGKRTYVKNYPWGLLAGNLEYGEDPEKAIVREIKEEAGLIVETQEILLAVSAREDHHISLVYHCEVVSGEFQPSAEISEIRFFSVDELPEMLRTEKVLIMRLYEHFNIL